MAEKFAVRTIRLCTKDCLCLYVCPTGAADTENSIIDVDKCIGCGACAAACPSGAISMVPRALPPQQKHSPEVLAALKALIHTKAEAEAVAAALPGQLAAAVERSSRIMVEDLFRESGYMLPQSKNSHDFLRSLLTLTDPDLPRAAVEQLLNTIEQNED